MKYSNCAIGAIAPEITGKDTLDNIIKLSDLRGKYVIVDFGAQAVSTVDGKHQI